MRRCTRNASFSAASHAGALAGAAIVGALARTGREFERPPLRRADRHGIPPDGKQNEIHRCGVHYAALVSIHSRGNAPVNLTPNLILVFAASYLLGSIPFGMVMAKLFGAGDVRRAGSGNIGATNVARVAGTVPGLLTLLLDAVKGWIAVFLVGWLRVVLG